MNFDDKRKDKLKNTSMRIYDDDNGRKAQLFKQRGASFAVVRFTRGGLKVSGFVPLVPRHMTTENWRDLFWLDPKRLVINGDEYKELCSICRHALFCLSKGKGVSYLFDCRTTPGDLTVKLTKRKKGDSACPR